MVREGVNAIKAGRKDEARAFLMKATELDPYNEDAWLWLSGIVDAADDQRTCLENVLAINPGNQRALQGLAYLEGKPMPSAASKPAPPAAPPPAPTSSAPTPPPASAATASSVEWDFGAVETSSASSHRAVNEPTAKEYDDWVNNLGLAGEQPKPGAPARPAAAGGAAPGAATATGAAAENSPFGDFSFDEVAEDAFFQAGSPFTPKAPAAEPEPLPPPAAKAAPKREARAKPEPEPEPVDEDVVGELFGAMPASIVATRLPGTDERVSPLLRIAVFLLIVVNLIAATLLVFKLVA
jgi:hypothetical protein